MKRINNLILALAGLFAAACADTFEERYDLAVNTDRYSVTAEAGKLPVTVYCSGAWTAQLTAESAWATLDRTAGSGITTIRLNYADNPGLARSVGVVLRGSGLEKTVTVVQKAGITAPELIFLSEGPRLRQRRLQGHGGLRNQPARRASPRCRAGGDLRRGGRRVDFRRRLPRRRHGGGRDRNPAGPPGADHLLHGRQRHGRTPHGNGRIFGRGCRRQCLRRLVHRDAERRRGPHHARRRRGPPSRAADAPWPSRPTSGRCLRR